MPVVLSQHPYSERYRDVEGVIYNFPPQYYDQINAFERFLYYRPSKGAPAREQSTYIGHGILGAIYVTPDATALRTVEIASVQYFRHPVPFRDVNGALYESGFDSPSAFQGRAVRRIGDVDFFRILSAAHVTSAEMSTLVNVDDALLVVDSVRRSSPLRAVNAVPPGAGYIPSGATRPDPAETAALQERARADHQRTVQTLIDRTLAAGGQCFMNNNIDLLSKGNGETILFEAKSLTDVRMAIDRMRYGVGQLADYQRRYAEVIGDHRTAMAFANRLGSDEAFVADVLDAKDIGLVVIDGDNVLPRNESASALFVCR